MLLNHPENALSGAVIARTVGRRENGGTFRAEADR